MNSMDKMEDYDRVARVAEKLAKELEVTKQRIAELESIAVNYQDKFYKTEDGKEALEKKLAEREAKVLEVLRCWINSQWQPTGWQVICKIDRMANELRASASNQSSTTKKE